MNRGIDNVKRLPGYMRFFTCMALLGVLCSGPNEPDEVVGGGHPLPNPSICGMVSVGGGITLDAGDAEISIFEIVQHDSCDYSWDLLETVHADSSGGYEFNSIPAGNYSLVYSKDAYKAFSGYIELQEDDTILVLDTVFLEPTISIMGAVRQTDAYQVVISFLGMADQGPAEMDVIMPDENRYFIFDGIPSGDYILELSLDYNGPEEENVYLSLPARLVTQTDTSYVDTAYGCVSTVTISDNTFELVNEHLKITCLVIDD